MQVNFWKSGPINAAHRGLLACAVAGASALALAAFTTATTGTARASSNAPADYVVASFPVDEGRGGTQAVFTQLEAKVCLPPPPSPIGFRDCNHLPSLVISPLGVSGTVTWTDGSSPYFENIVSAITDGVPGYIEAADTDPVGFVQSIHAASEPQFFGAQVGPSGVDLAGYAIHRIGFRVDSISIESPGTDPNGDGNWTDFSLSGAFLFEGTIANSEACRNGGWQRLHGPGGSSFMTQGQCIHFVNTGK
jgi:hypothetical protein